MRLGKPRLSPKWPSLKWLSVAAAAIAAAALWSTAGWWWPAASALAFGAAPAAQEADDHAPHDDHDDHGGGADDVIRLSEQARGTIGLQTAEVALSDFDRTITVPGVVAERPGRSSFRVAAPVNGIVTDLFATEGQAVTPGEVLFILRLTHEDVVEAQTDYLKTLEALDVENREIARLEAVTRGVVAGKVVLERKYERQKLEGLLKAQREALLAHGFGEEAVDRVAAERSLIREVRVVVPEPHDPGEEGHLERHGPTVRAAFPTAAPSQTGSPDLRSTDEPAPLTLERIAAHAGDAVETGDPLAELSDLRLLYIEGRAFERDAAAVAAAARENGRITALPTDSLGPDADPVRGLEIAYVGSRVDGASRALPFYVLLPNEVVRDDRVSSEGGAAGRFISWKYRPGQRMRLRVPVETYEDVIVLPVAAVAEAGAERFVFVENGATFERRPVRVEYRDAYSVVVADDGSLLPGETVAVTAAHQLQMALKNAAGGGADPHAGHNH